jgi:hypothetical protein
MTPYEEFMTTTPSTSEHLEYMARAAKRYPNLPPGAQQNALNCLEMKGKTAAAFYTRNARSRWPLTRFVFTMPKRSMRGVYTATPKERREQKERLARYRAYMAAGKIAAERKIARGRKIYEKRLRRATAQAEIRA